MTSVLFQRIEFWIFLSFWQVFCAWFYLYCLFYIIPSKQVNFTISSLLLWSVTDFDILVVGSAARTQSFPQRQNFIISSRFADPEKF